MSSCQGTPSETITLRYALSEYTKWVAAVWSAGARGLILPMDAQQMLEELRAMLRLWVGERLLNTPL